MTNPINIGLNIVSSMFPAAAPDRTGAPGASDFAILLESAMGLGKQAAPDPLGGKSDTSALSASLVDPIDLDALSDALGDMLSLLSGLEENVEDELPFDPEALESLSGLLEAVTDMFDTGAVIVPDSPVLEQLRDLAQKLGIGTNDTKAAPVAVLESLAGLATRIGSALRESEPALANALTGLARRLDTQIAGIETALADVEPDAGMRLKLVESETRPNAAAAIARHGEDGPDDKQQSKVNPGAPSPDRPAKPGASTNSPSSASPADADMELPRLDQRATTDEAGRTLTRPEGNAPEKPQPNANANANASTAPVQAAASGAAMATASASAASESGTDAPDGLTLASTQPGGTGNAPGTMRPEASAYTRPEPRMNMPHIAIEIARSIQNGLSRFEIRLNPPELGRIDVRLEMDQSGNVTARLAVEKSETLDLLQRDQRALERALGEAGVDTGKTDLEFSLRQESDGRQEADDRETWKASVGIDADTAESLQGQPLPDGAIRGYARLDAVNLWV